MKDNTYKTMDNWLTPNGQKSLEPYIGMRMKTGKKFTALHNQIYQAYKKDPTVVNDEALLFGTLFEPVWDYSLTPTQNLLKLPRDSNVCRRRQELHEAGLITYSKKATKRREEGMRNERDRASPISPQMKSVAGVDLSPDVTQEEIDSFNKEVYSYTEATPYEQTSLLIIRNTE